MGRGDSHVNIAVIHSADAELSEAGRAAYESALEDYLKSIELDQSLVDVYGKAADVYLALGDKDSAIAILEQGYEATNDENLLDRRRKLRVIGTDEVIWTDPIFEQMIRTELGLPDGPVYVRDLDSVENLYIHGDQFIFINKTAREDNMGWRYMDGDPEDAGELAAYYGVLGQDSIGDQLYTQRGGITSVDSLRYFRKSA